MSKNYLNKDDFKFNMKRLSSRPKIIYIIIIGVLIGFTLFIIMNSSNNTVEKNEIPKERTDNDEYVKNMADNPDNYLKKELSISEDDFDEIFKNDNISISESQEVNTDVNRAIIKEITNNSNNNDNNSNVYPILPVWKQDDNNTLHLATDDNVINLTAEQINTYNANRFSELEQALKSTTNISIKTAEQQIPANKSIQKTTMNSNTSPEIATYDYINDMLNGGNKKEIQADLLDGDFKLNQQVEKSREGEIKTGFVIPATLITEINSSVQGMVVGQVRQNVFDTATGTQLLIPQGSKLIGEYSSDVPYGNNRLFMSWKRIVFPNGDSLDLGSMPGADMAGRSGFEDKVNTHFWKIFGNSLMFSFIIAGTNIITSETIFNKILPVYSRSVAGSMGDALAVSLGQTMSDMIQRNLNIAPEITIRSGFLFNVMITKDIILPEYNN